MWTWILRKIRGDVAEAVVSGFGDGLRQVMADEPLTDREAAERLHLLLSGGEVRQIAGPKSRKGAAT